MKRTVHCRSFTEPQRLAPRTNGNQLLAFCLDRYGGPVRTHLPDGLSTIVKYNVTGERCGVLPLDGIRGAGSGVGQTVVVGNAAGACRGFLAPINLPFHESVSLFCLYKTCSAD